VDFPTILQHFPSELSVLLPELFLATGILLAMVSEFLVGGMRLRTVWFAGFVAFCSLLLSCIDPGISQHLGTPFEPDRLTLFVRVYASLGALLATVSIAGSSRWKGRPEAGEAAIMILSVALGAMLFASATNLLTVLLSLEFLSLCSYGLAGFRGHDARASEAGLKYVLYGGVASAIALFGISHIFGMTGSLELATIGRILSSGTMDKALLVPIILFCAAYGYKLSLVPFHFWGPDVYEGCPAISAGFLSTVPKAAGFVGLLHALLALFPSWSNFVVGGKLPMFLALFGVASTLVGAVAAGMQKDARRILAFSSTSNAGTALIVLSSWITVEAVAVLEFFLLTYLLANFGAFLALDRLENETGSSTLERLSGAWKRRPWTTLALGVCLVSLAGVPPMAGFTAKWSILREVLRAGSAGGAGWIVLVAPVGILVSSVSLAWAYLRILRATTVDDGGTGETVAVQPMSGFVLAACSLGVLGLGWGWPVIEFLRRIIER